MVSQTEGPSRRDLFALVIYIPGPLGRFLDDLRKELIIGCRPRAHVTVLPPRPLTVDKNVAIAELRQGSYVFAPFDLTLGEIEVFPETDVIYLSLAKGGTEMRGMYKALNNGGLSFKEPFAYHPHVTLAQGLAPTQVKPLFEAASKRWAEFPHSHNFRGEKFTFVKSTDCVNWADLAEFSLDGVPSAR